MINELWLATQLETPHGAAFALYKLTSTPNVSRLDEIFDSFLGDLKLAPAQPREASRRELVVSRRPTSRSRSSRTSYLWQKKSSLTTKAAKIEICTRTVFQGSPVPNKTLQ